MKLLLRTAVLLAVVGAIDAMRGEHWDQLAILAVIGILCGAVLAIQPANGRVVVPRADLMVWVTEMAARTDDEPSRVVDRALAAYRAAFVPEGDDEQGQLP